MPMVGMLWVVLAQAAVHSRLRKVEEGGEDARHQKLPKELPVGWTDAGAGFCECKDGSSFGQGQDMPYRFSGLHTPLGSLDECFTKASAAGAIAADWNRGYNFCIATFASLADCKSNLQDWDDSCSDGPPCEQKYHIGGGGAYGGVECYKYDKTAAMAFERQRAVDEHNGRHNTTWRAALNGRFEQLPLGASKSLCGVKTGAAARLQAAVRSGRVRNVSSLELGVHEVPNAFDAAAHWPKCATVINDVRDQSACGCCWAFAPAEAASDRMCIATNGTLAYPLSAQDTCFCAGQPSSEGGCGGGDPADAWTHIQTSGIVSGAQQTGGTPKDDPFGAAGLCSRFSLPHCHHHGPTGSDPFPAEDTPKCPDVTNSPSCPYECDHDAT
eukprot:2112288-Prymnesium_polylepis.1